MSFDTIILEKKEGVAYITFNRPEVHNAINEEMITEFGQAIADLNKDEMSKRSSSQELEKHFNQGQT